MEEDKKFNAGLSYSTQIDPELCEKEVKELNFIGLLQDQFICSCKYVNPNCQCNEYKPWLRLMFIGFDSLKEIKSIEEIKNYILQAKGRIMDKYGFDIPDETIITIDLGCHLINKNFPKTTETIKSIKDNKYSWKFPLDKISWKTYDNNY